MGDWRQLSEAADELEKLHRRLGEIVEQEEDGWQLELVRVRRLLSDLATHQRSYSAVAVGEDGRAYRESAAAMLKAGVAFLQ